MQDFKIGVITLLMPPRYMFLPELLLSERKVKTLKLKANKNTILSTGLEWLIPQVVIKATLFRQVCT